MFLPFAFRPARGEAGRVAGLTLLPIIFRWVEPVFAKAAGYHPVENPIAGPSIKRPSFVSFNGSKNFDVNRHAVASYRAAQRQNFNFGALTHHAACH